MLNEGMVEKEERLSQGAPWIHGLGKAETWGYYIKLNNIMNILKQAISCKIPAVCDSLVVALKVYATSLLPKPGP